MPAEGAVPGEREHCIVVAGGDAPDPQTVAHLELPEDAFVIAADSGVDHALASGLHVDVAIGDFDSVSAGGLDEVIAAGARVERHPAAKDHTDLELALDEALVAGAHDVIVLGGDGGRRDHLFANFLLLPSPRYRTCCITAYLGRSRVHVLHGGQVVRLAGEHGELVSLLPVHGPAEGVRTDGLRYPLHGETLPPGTTRGVSNVLETPPAEVLLDAGTLVAVVPGEQMEKRRDA
jgi:thiamine pyrophosphokinase